jgi:hypothetical protein
MKPLLERYQLWDVAGVDGLQFVKSLAKCDRISSIAPFQSIETSINGYPCSILRLCEGNFRLAWQGDSSVLEQAQQEIQGYRAWLKRFEWLGAIAIPESMGIDYLPQIAVAKPPYRLTGLPCDRAVPARIDDISVLVWRHLVLDQPIFELHTAVKNLGLVKAKLNVATINVN